MDTIKRIKIMGEITHDGSAICWKLPPPVPTQPSVELLPKEQAPGDPSVRMRELLADMNGPSFGIRISYDTKSVRSVPIVERTPMLQETMALIAYIVQGKERVSMTWISELVRSLRQCGIVDQLHLYDVESNDHLQVPGFEQATARSGADGIVPVVDQAAQVTTGGAS